MSDISTTDWAIDNLTIHNDSRMPGQDILEECRVNDITEITLIADNGKAGDERIAIYRIGYTRVADTGGGARWESAMHATEFAELLAECGIEDHTAGQ